MSNLITSADAVIYLSVASVFPSPVQLQGFAADDVFNTDPLDNAEVEMGVDGNLSAGFVFVPVKQMYTLSASSDSNFLFDQWYAAEQSARTKYVASGQARLPAVNRKWTMVKGFLTTYPPMPDGKKVLQPRKYGITWQAIRPAPV